MPVFLPADIYQRLVEHVIADAPARKALNITDCPIAGAPDFDRGVFALGEVLDVWSEDHRAVLEAA